MVTRWLVDISPLFLVLLKGKDGFCWFCYCGWGKVWLLLVPSLRLKKEMAAEEATAGRVAQLVSGCCVDREGRPVNGVHGGCKLGEWGLAKGEGKIACRGKVLAEEGGRSNDGCYGEGERRRLPLGWERRPWLCVQLKREGRACGGWGEEETKGEKAGIGEKGVLVLWSGVCGGCSGWDGENGGALAGGWLREEKKIRKMGVTTWFRPEKKLGFWFFVVVALNFSLKKYCSL